MYRRGGLRYWLICKEMLLLWESIEAYRMLSHFSTFLLEVGLTQRVELEEKIN
jgi:hypothetical protein